MPATLKKRLDEVRHSDSRVDVVSVINSQGISQYLSGAYKDYFGLDPQGRIGKNVMERIHPDDAVQVTAALTYMIDTQQKVHVDYRVKHADGHWVMVSSEAAPLIDDGEFKGFVVVSRCKTTVDPDLRSVAEPICSDEEHELRPALIVSFEGKVPKIVWIQDEVSKPTIRYISEVPED